MTERLFADGALVDRIEARDITLATVVSAEGADGPDAGWTYLINYSEGGSGYWPEDSLQAHVV